MIKKLLLIILCHVAVQHCNAQDFDSLLKEGRRSVYAEYNSGKFDARYHPDYAHAQEVLEKAVKIQPDNAEAHYFLACAIDYSGNPDASAMDKASKEKTIAASNEFEKVIRISPQYDGYLSSLDPYAKITSIWGCLARAYLFREAHDSAVWALNEGKRRGGFSPFCLDLYRLTLRKCPRNTIFFPEGDISVTCLLYLQEVEKTRTDVTVVSIDLIQTTWYNSWLYKHHPSLFSSSRVALNTNLFGNKYSPTATVNAASAHKQITWPVPTRLGFGYLQLRDVVLLDIVINNRFRQPIYFESNADAENLVGLTRYIKQRVFFGILTTDTLSRNPEMASILADFPPDLIKEANKYSKDELIYVNNFRVFFLRTIEMLITDQKLLQAKKLYSHMQVCIPEESFPYKNEYTEQVAKKLAKQLE